VNVIELLDAAVERHASDPAIVHGASGAEKTWTFAEVSERSRRIAALFRAQGLQPGDALLVFVPMSPLLYVIMAAALRIGLTPVIVEPSAWRADVDSCTRHLRLRGFVGTPMACVIRWFVPQLRTIPIAFTTGPALPGLTALSSAERCEPLTGWESCPPEAPALVTFTSGSTGRPKGVLRTHRVLAESQRLLVRELGTQPGELGFTIIPFFVFSNLAAGAASWLPDIKLGQPSQIPVERVGRELAWMQPHSLVLSPAFAERLAQWCIGENVTLPRLRRVFVGGAPVFPRTLDRLAAVAVNADISALYGATEAEPIAMQPLADWSVALREQSAAGGGLALGIPANDATVRIRREPGNPDGVGEILVAGPHVSPGYLGGEGDRENKLELDGVRWHRTGDAGRIDATGRLWLLGRCSARIADAKGTTYPLAVEAALSFRSDWPRAAFTSFRGRRVLVLETQPELARAQLSIGVQSVSAAGIDEVLFVRAIPVDRRHNAKVDYRALAGMLEGGAAGKRIEARALDGGAEG
jgi:acyl-CoA synthetase (AMP-forming)/AMP-acid ligase II